MKVRVIDIKWESTQLKFTVTMAKSCPTRWGWLYGLGNIIIYYHKSCLHLND